jgi:hypothetical protein
VFYDAVNVSGSFFARLQILVFRNLHDSLKPFLDYMQDTTSHPTWTGDKSSLTGQDGRAAEFMRKFGKPDASAAGKEQT